MFVKCGKIGTLIHCQKECKMGVATVENGVSVTQKIYLELAI